MGKTLTGLLEIAAAIALQFVPGLGTVAGISLGLTLAAAGLTTLLTKAPKPPTTEGAQKQSTPARVSGYGRMRLHGAYILFETASDGTAVDVWAFHDGQIDEIEQYYLGDIRVKLDNGWVMEDDSGNGQFGSNTSGQGGGCVRIGANLGMTPGVAWSLVISEVPDHWTVNHRGDGVVTGYMLSRSVKSKNFQTVYASGGPNQTPMSLAMRMQLVFDWRDTGQSVTDSSTWKWSENAVLHLAHYLMLRMSRDWSTYFVPTLSYWTAAANDADVPMPLSQVQSNLYVKADKGDTALYLVSANGLHAGMSVTISVSGDHANDEVRTVTSVEQFDPFWRVYFSGGALSNLHPQGSEVDWVADPANPPTEPRYRSCVVHQHTDQNKDVLAHLLACFDGFLSENTTGALVVYSGRYIAPTVSIGPDDIVSYSYQQFVAEEDAINTLKVSYVSQNHDFNVVQADDWTDEDDIAARGRILSQGLDNQVPSYTQARRLAKRALSRAMPPSQGSCVVTASGRTVIGQRYINLNLTEAGVTFLNAPVEIVKWTNDTTTGGGSFDWIEADPDVDAWNPATEDGNPAPIGNRVGTQPLDAPTIDSVTPSYGQTTLGQSGVSLIIAATGPDRTDLTWYVRTRPTGFEAWLEQAYPDTDPGASRRSSTS